VAVRGSEPGGRSIAHPGKDANRHRVVIVSKLALVPEFGMRAGTSARSIPVIEETWGEFPGLKVIGSSE